MKFTIKDLHQQLLDLKGIYGIYLDEDVVINKELNIYMKARLQGVNKPYIKQDERVLITAIPVQRFYERILFDATLHVFAVQDVIFKNIPENVDKYKNPKEYADLSEAYAEEYESFQRKYYNDIKEQMEAIKQEAIKCLIIEINTPKLRQILWSLGYKDADNITSLTNTDTN